MPTFAEADAHPTMFDTALAERILFQEGREAYKDYVLRRMSNTTRGSVVFTGDDAPQPLEFLSQQELLKIYLRVQESQELSDRREVEAATKQQRPVRRVKPWSAAGWYSKAAIPILCLDSDPMMDRSYITDNGRRCVNMSSKMLNIDEPRQYKDFPENVRQRVDFIRTHMLKAFCSGHETQFDYLEQALARTVRGERSNALIYMLMPQALGKSIWLDFLTNHVFGQNVCYISNSPETITGTFNGALAGNSS